MDKKEIFYEVDKYIEEIATLNRIEAFYPDLFSRKLNIPIELVMIALTDCVNNGKILLKYEIKCLNDFTTIKTVESMENLLNQTIECTLCGEEFQIDYSNIYPKFYIDPKYKEFIKKKK
ncbi:hypothetical protein QTG94_14470 [Clostridium perfringens]|nr:hypothetical protein [Clostridium perfringens]